MLKLGKATDGIPTVIFNQLELQSKALVATGSKQRLDFIQNLLAS